MDKILIIKTGFSETFAEDTDGSICSLGDVLRTIPLIISQFKSKNTEISWLTDSKAFGLFELFDHDFKLLDIDSFNSTLSEFNYVLNLEKGYKVKGENCYGFISSNEIRDIVHKEVHSYSFPILDETSYEEKFQKYFNFLAPSYNYQVNPKFIIDESYDVGFNWKSGVKWPSKVIEKSYWDSWERALSKNISVSWQQGFEDLETYILWIASCKSLITLDSLGLHIARILKRRVIALFGPTTCERSSFNSNDKFFFYRNETEKKELENKLIGSFVDE